jgi:hypothetical protein
MAAMFKKKKEEPINVDDLINAATGDDHEQFLAYLRQPHRAFMKPGRSVREEYGNWLADSARRKAAQAATTAGATGATNS